MYNPSGGRKEGKKRGKAQGSGAMGIKNSDECLPTSIPTRPGRGYLITTAGKREKKTRENCESKGATPNSWGLNCSNLGPKRHDAKRLEKGGKNETGEMKEGREGC